MNGFQNPYTSKGFGPALSATRGFLSQYMQYMQMRNQLENQRIMNQYRQSLLEQGQQRLDVSKQYLQLAKEREEAPETPSQMLSKKLFGATEEWGQEEWGAAAKKKFLGAERQPFTEGAIAKTLGELESGGAKSIWGLDVMQFGKGERGRQNAINHALRNLGPDWPQIAPEAAEIIERKWPGEQLLSPDLTKSFGIRRLTPEIAREYLEKAGGDRRRAVEMATADGYIE